MPDTEETQLLVGRKQPRIERALTPQLFTNHPVVDSVSHLRAQSGRIN